jgi:hypothetical protein
LSPQLKGTVQQLERQLQESQQAAAEVAAQQAEGDSAAARGAAGATPGGTSEEEVAAMRAKLAKAKKQFQVGGWACFAVALVLFVAAKALHCHDWVPSLSL